MRDSFRNAFGRNGTTNGQQPTVAKKFGTLGGASEKRDSQLDVIDDQLEKGGDDLDSLRTALADSNSR